MTGKLHALRSDACTSESDRSRDRPRRQACRTRKKVVMGALQVFVTRHAVLAYFTLAFAVSWIGGVLVLGPSGIPTTTEQLMTLGAAVYGAMLAGPSVAGLLMTSLVSGREGLRELLARLLTWRVGGRWYAVALLTAPLLAAVASLALSIFSPEFLPAIFTTNDTSFLLSGVTAGLLVGFFEELGWTAFVTPQLRCRYGVLSTGLIVGVMWGAWHFLLFWEPDSFSGAIPLTVLLARLFSWLPPYRVLMVWVYDQTGSLLVAMLMHASLTATQLIFMPAPVVGMTLVTSILAWAATLWIVVVLLGALSRWQISRQPQVDAPMTPPAVPASRT
jgi:membrane protease YdiL (CAAX protease family)